MYISKQNIGMQNILCTVYQFHICVQLYLKRQVAPGDGKGDYD